jgi:hypothetical protein
MNTDGFDNALQGKSYHQTAIISIFTGCIFVTGFMPTSTWDMDLLRKMGEALAEACIAGRQHGLTVLFTCQGIDIGADLRDAG